MQDWRRAFPRDAAFARTCCAGSVCCRWWCADGSKAFEAWNCQPWLHSRSGTGSSCGCGGSGGRSPAAMSCHVGIHFHPPSSHVLPARSASTRHVGPRGTSFVATCAAVVRWYSMFRPKPGNLCSSSGRESAQLAQNAAGAVRVESRRPIHPSRNGSFDW